MPENDWPWLQKHTGPRYFQIWIMGPKIRSTPTKMVLPYNFGFIKKFPSLTVEAVDAPQTLFRAPLTLGVGVQGGNHFKNLFAIKIYTYAKFHPDWSVGLDFYKVRIYIFCALYIRVNLLKILTNFRLQQKNQHLNRMSDILVYF